MEPIHGMTLGERAKAIFLDALDLEADERPSFLDSACDSPALRERVDRLLGAHAESELPASFVPPVASVPALGVNEGHRALAAGDRLGAYRLIEEIGEGGFGVVWVVEQEEPLVRRVALKVLKAGMDTREVLRRFEGERRVLARMDHPHIATVHDGGTTREGLPYFVMELVDGPPVTDYAQQYGLDLEARLRLFGSICRAVQHAHQKSVVHRDLKPSNVLVADVDGVPVVKVIDFGIAKLMTAEDGTGLGATREGQLLGTPAYMSPEQIDGSADVDTRSDVYSLGVLLYELVADCGPFHAATAGGMSLTEIQRMVLEVEPPRPSTSLHKAAEAKPDAELAGRARRARGDLDWIVMRCLEKRPERRYDSAGVLADEIERFLGHEPVLAGPPELSYRMRRFARRHRTALATAAGLALMLVAGTVVSLSQARRALAAERVSAQETERARVAAEEALASAREAEASADEAEYIAQFLQEVFLSVDPAVAQGQDRTLIEALLGDAVKRLEAGRRSREVDVRLVETFAFAYLGVASYAHAEPLFKRALEMHTELHGADDPRTLDARHNLGALYLHWTRIDAAEELLLEVLARREELLGPEHPDTIETLGLVGLVLAARGRYGEANELLGRVEEQRIEQLGEAHPDAILAMNNHARALRDSGRLLDGTLRLEQVLRLQREASGDLHPRTLAAIHNLASAYESDGRAGEALPLYEHVIEAKRSILPPGHPSRVVSLNNLARVLQVLQRTEEAEAMFREALGEARLQLGPTDTRTLTLLNNLGILLARRGATDEAELLLEEAARGLRLVHGGDHPSVRSAEASLARLRSEQER